MIVKILLIVKSGFFKDQLVYFIKALLCNTVFCFAWPGVEGTAEFFTLDFERSQQMLRPSLLESSWAQLGL